ncbi:AAA family ATPase [Sulfuricystis multivorans]|uniref:AAA family ATPase n=1 Tax=Sulfuricystis multivorans TaxID=2211108 RepID=UPI000F81FDED|nr:AAA family ATPase [Sulfuricystis multivorans]
MFDLSAILVPVSYSLCEVFGFDPNEVDPSITVEGFQIPDPATLSDPVAQQHATFLRAAVPPIDPYYQFRKELVRDIRYWWLTGEGDVLLLWGPTGSGKTSVFEQWCARLGIPLFMAKGHRRFEPHEAFGQFVGGENGTTPWVDGPVTLAARYGLPCIINEYDRIAADRTIVFNDVFEGRSFPIPGKSGEVVTPQPGFRVAITANTNLVEDLSGNYGTANTHDISLLERIVALHVGYPTDDTEARLLEKELEQFSDDLLSYWFDQEGIKISTPQGMKEGSAINRSEFIQGLLEVAKKIRAQSKDGGNTSDSALERTMSTRILRKWARHSVAQASAPEKLGLSALHLSLKKYLSSLATESTRIALHQAVENVFGVSEVVKP